MHLKQQTFGNIFPNDNRIFTPQVTLLLFLLCLNYSKIKDTRNTPAFSIDNPSHTGSNKAGSTQKSSMKKRIFEEGCAKWRSQKSCCNNSRNPKVCKAMGTTPTHRPRQGTRGSLEEGGTRDGGIPQEWEKGFRCPRSITMQLLETSSFLR